MAVQHCQLDVVTDCYDLFQLVTGQKGIPADKTQRLSILSLREDRLSGRIRRVYHWPTEVMVMDGLTKVGIYPQLMSFLSCGIIEYERFFKRSKKELVVQVRELTCKDSFEETELIRLEA